VWSVEQEWHANVLYFASTKCCAGEGAGVAAPAVGGTAQHDSSLRRSELGSADMRLLVGVKAPRGCQGSLSVSAGG